MWANLKPRRRKIYSTPSWENLKSHRAKTVDIGKIKELRQQMPSTQILKHRLIIRMSNTFFSLYLLHSFFFGNNTLQNIFRNPCFLEVQSMCYASLLDDAVLLPLEDFNFNWFYIVKYTKNHKYDLDSQTKQIKR